MNGQSNRTTLPDIDDESSSDRDGHATDRRTFLGALGASTLPLALASAPTALQAANETVTVPWTESFELDDGTTDDGGETAWELENPDAHPDVAVEANALTLGETDGTARWESEPIDVSSVDAVELTVTVSGSGDLRAPPDRDPPAVDGSSPPTDPDEDGIYEDVDGDGDVDMADANALLANIDDSAVTEHAAAYDTNCNDRVDYTDVIALGREASGDEGAAGECVRVGDALTVAYEVDGDRTVVSQLTDVASDGETIEATGVSGEELVVEITARTADPETTYHVEAVSVAEPDDDAAEGVTLVADRAPDGSRLSARPDGPAYQTTDGTVHLFTWDEPADGARAVLYDEDESTDWGAGPDIHVYDTMERSDASAGDVPSRVATRGQWDNYSGVPELRQNGHSGDFAARVQHQDQTNKFEAQFPETTELFLSYCVKIPEGHAMPGTEAPGEFPESSVWKMAWLYNEDVGASDDDVDICLPSWSGGQMVSIGGNNLDPSISIQDESDWWQWGEWMRFSFWLESGPDPDEDPGQIRWQVVTEGDQTQVVAENTTPVMVGGQAPFAWRRLNIPGWAQNKDVSGDNVEALYDDIYVATGGDSNARVELSDSTSYADSTRIQLCDIRSWSTNRVSATLRTGSLDAVEGAAIHLTTADEEQAVSMGVTDG